MTLSSPQAGRAKDMLLSTGSQGAAESDKSSGKKSKTFLSKLKNTFSKKHSDSTPIGSHSALSSKNEVTSTSHISAEGISIKPVFSQDASQRSSQRAQQGQADRQSFESDWDVMGAGSSSNTHLANGFEPTAPTSTTAAGGLTVADMVQLGISDPAALERLARHAASTMPQSLTASEDPAVTTDAGLSSSRPLQPSTSINLNSQRPSSLFQQRSGEGSKTSSRELTSLASPVIGQLSKRSSGAAPPEVPRPLARQSQPFGNSRQGSTPGNLHAARQQASRGSMPGSPLSARRRSQSFSVVGDHSAPASPRSPLSVRQASEQVGSVRMAPRKPSGLVPLAQDDLARRVAAIQEQVAALTDEELLDPRHTKKLNLISTHASDAADPSPNAFAAPHRSNSPLYYSQSHPLGATPGPGFGPQAVPHDPAVPFSAPSPLSMFQAELLRSLNSQHYLGHTLSEAWSGSTGRQTSRVVSTGTQPQLVWTPSAQGGTMGTLDPLGQWTPNTGSMAGAGGPPAMHADAGVMGLALPVTTEGQGGFLEALAQGKLHVSQGGALVSGPAPPGAGMGLPMAQAQLMDMQPMPAAPPHGIAAKNEGFMAHLAGAALAPQLPAFPQPPMPTPLQALQGDRVVQGPRRRTSEDSAGAGSRGPAPTGQQAYSDSLASRRSVPLQPVAGAPAIPPVPVPPARPPVVRTGSKAKFSITAALSEFAGGSSVSGGNNSASQQPRMSSNESVKHSPPLSPDPQAAAAAAPPSPLATQPSASSGMAWPAPAVRPVVPRPTPTDPAISKGISVFRVPGAATPQALARARGSLVYDAASLGSGVLVVKSLNSSDYGLQWNAPLQSTAGAASSRAQGSTSSLGRATSKDKGPAGDGPPQGASVSGIDRGKSTPDRRASQVAFADVPQSPASDAAAVGDKILSSSEASDRAAADERRAVRRAQSSGLPRQIALQNSGLQYMDEDTLKALKTTRDAQSETEPHAAPAGAPTDTQDAAATAAGGEVEIAPAAAVADSNGAPAAPGREVGKAAWPTKAQLVKALLSEASTAILSMHDSASDALQAGEPNVGGGAAGNRWSSYLRAYEQAFLQSGNGVFLSAPDETQDLQGLTALLAGLDSHFWAHGEAGQSQAARLAGAEAAVAGARRPAAPPLPAAGSTAVAPADAADRLARPPSPTPSQNAAAKQRTESDAWAAPLSADPSQRITNSTAAVTSWSSRVLPSYTSSAAMSTSDRSSALPAPQQLAHMQALMSSLTALGFDASSPQAMARIQAALAAIPRASSGSGDAAPQRSSRHEMRKQPSNASSMVGRRPHSPTMRSQSGFTAQLLGTTSSDGLSQLMQGVPSSTVATAAEVLAAAALPPSYDEDGTPIPFAVLDESGQPVLVPRAIVSSLSGSRRLPTPIAGSRAPSITPSDEPQRPGLWPKRTSASTASETTAGGQKALRVRDSDTSQGGEMVDGQQDGLRQRAGKSGMVAQVSVGGMCSLAPAAPLGGWADPREPSQAGGVFGLGDSDNPWALRSVIPRYGALELSLMVAGGCVLLINAFVMLYAVLALRALAGKS